MSITATLNNALTGLAAASRSAQVVSTNVSNATTEGYARREINLSARILGGDGAGVQVDGIARIVDDNLLRERRLAAAGVGNASVTAEFQEDFLVAIGEPQDPASLSAKTSSLEAALLSATSRPESDARLLAVLDAAQSLAGKLNDVSDSVQTQREDADRAIMQDVSRLNESLVQIAELNALILRARSTNQSYPALLDARQKLVDDISELMPIQQLQRGNDTIALYSKTGALLVDIEPAEFGFVGTSPIAPDMTRASGALAGLTLNGTAVETNGANAPIAGGRLAGLFSVRDDLAVEAQSNLDAMARDLVQRFEDPSLDGTLVAGQPGLFTDQGGPLDPLDTIGLAGRLAINASVDPAQGGAVWRLRNGIGATVTGPVGDASLLSAMLQRLEETRAPLGGTFSPSERSVSTFASDLASLAGQALNLGNTNRSFEQARYIALNDELLANGVDTDQEMQKLLLIEQAYAANAKVVQTVDELVQILIGL